MTVPYDGEYLRDPRERHVIHPPVVQDGITMIAEEHDIPTAKMAAAFGPQSHAEPRSGAGEGTDKGETSEDCWEPDPYSPGRTIRLDNNGTTVTATAVFRPADVTISATGPEITIHGDERDLCVMNLANSETLRDMLDDVIGSVGGKSYQAEADRLREAVKRVRNYANAADMRNKVWAKTHNPACECATEETTTLLIEGLRKALGEEA